MKVILKLCCVTAFICLNTILWAQNQQPPESPTYKVPPVYLPAIERPAITLKNLGELKLMGRLPEYDGGKMQINLESSRVSSFTSAQQEIERIFKQIGLNADVKSLEPRTKEAINTPAAQETEETREQRQQFDERIKAKGTLNSNTVNNIKQTESSMNAMAKNDMRVFAFRQMYDGLEIENAGILFAVRKEAFHSITGNIYGEVRIENQKSFDERKAIDAAISYIKRYSKVAKAEGNSKPVMVLLPYKSTFRYAWKVMITGEDGPYNVWVDASSGEVLQLLPDFFFAAVNAKALVFNPIPQRGTREVNFLVNPAVDGKYTLSLDGFGKIAENYGADGNTDIVSITDDGSGTANFNVSPINGTVVERKTMANYNSLFQQVNVFTWIYRAKMYFQALGGQSLGEFNIRVNKNEDNAWSSMIFGAGSATLVASGGSYFNFAIDATVTTHEFGHNILGANYGAHGGSLTGASNEGQADFIADTYYNLDTIGGWSGKNFGITEGGGLPRMANAVDVFPEHRSSSLADGHEDGQIIAWALWNYRREMSELGPLGVWCANFMWMRAINTAGVGITNGEDARRVEESFRDVEEQLVTIYGKGSWTYKVTSAFARAGIFLSDKDAVIDIDDDYLNNSGSAPVFTVWTGRDYGFTGDNINATQPFNTKFVIDVANDAAFSVNHYTTAELTGVTAAAGGTATWTLDATWWNTLKTGDKIYYKVRTVDAGGGSARNSSSPGNGFITGVEPAFAVVNGTGTTTCTCGSTNNPSNNSSVGGVLPALLLLIPILLASYRRYKLSRQN